jgi:hypothetical protein
MPTIALQDKGKWKFFNLNIVIKGQIIVQEAWGSQGSDYEYVVLWV